MVGQKVLRGLEGLISVRLVASPQISSRLRLAKRVAASTTVLNGPWRRSHRCSSRRFSSLYCSSTYSLFRQPNCFTPLESRKDSNELKDGLHTLRSVYLRSFPEFLAALKFGVMGKGGKLVTTGLADFVVSKCAFSFHNKIQTRQIVVPTDIPVCLRSEVARSRGSRTSER